MKYLKIIWTKENLEMLRRDFEQRKGPKKRQNRAPKT